MELRSRRSRVNVDRVARLTFVVALSSGAYLIFKSIFIMFVNVFSISIYTKNFFNDDYVLSTCFLGIAIFLSITTVKYIFLELYTYNSFDNFNQKTEALNRADKAYSLIFKRLTDSFLIMVAIFLIMVIKNNMIINFSTLVIISIILIAIFFMYIYVNGERCNSLANYIKTKKFKKNITYLVSTLYVMFGIFICVAVLGLTLSMTTIYTLNNQATVSFDEKNDTLIKISLTNNFDTIVGIRIIDFYDSEAEEIILLDQKSESLTYSNAELKSDLLKDNKGIISTIKDIDNSIEKFDYTKAEYLQEYKYDLRNHIKEGKYVIEIVIINTIEERSEVTKFNTMIEKNNETIRIYKKDFSTTDILD